MSRNHTVRPTPPSASMQIETKLAARHVSFSFEPNLPIEKIREVEGNQVRLSEHRAPKDMVTRYAQQMKGGAVFPAIVVNDRYELIDGNTRWTAAKRNNKNTIAAYVCVDLSALQARSLSIELNQSHGQAMTEAEIHAFVTSAIDEGQVLDTKAYARMTGVKAATLTRWVAAKHFESRAARETIPAERLMGLSDSARAALNAVRLSAVFSAVTSLAADAKVPAAQLRAIVAEANAASSEAQALSIVARAYQERSEEIKAIAAGFKGARRRSAGSAPHIGGLLRFEVADLLDVSPERQGETFARMRLLRERLDGALLRATVEWDVLDGDGGGVRVKSAGLAVAR